MIQIQAYEFWYMSAKRTQYGLLIIIISSSTPSQEDPDTIVTGWETMPGRNPLSGVATKSTLKRLCTHGLYRPHQTVLQLVGRNQHVD